MFLDPVEIGNLRWSRLLSRHVFGIFPFSFTNVFFFCSSGCAYACRGISEGEFRSVPWRAWQSGKMQESKSSLQTLRCYRENVLEWRSRKSRKTCLAILCPSLHSKQKPLNSSQRIYAEAKSNLVNFILFFLLWEKATSTSKCGR
jgi:hypothetical protein